MDFQCLINAQKVITHLNELEDAVLVVVQNTQIIKLDIHFQLVVG